MTDFFFVFEANDMKIFRQTRGLVDKMMGAKKRSSLHRDSKMIDPMQSFTTIGEYHVDQKEDTPCGQALCINSL